MRKIETKEEKKKREERNKLIIGIILTTILVLSTAGYAFFGGKRISQEKKIDYNGFRFIKKEDGLWHVSIQNYDFSFFYNPKEVENISGYISLNLNSYFNKPLYFSYDSNTEGVSEILRNIGRFAERTQFVCLDNCSENLPIKNCSDNIVIIKEENNTLIRQEDNCIYILAEKEETLKAADSFIFRVLGIV